MQKTVLITGVFGGIGKSIAKEFKNAGYYVIGFDKQIEECNFIDLIIHTDLDRYVKDYEYQLLKNQEFELKISNLDVLVNNAAVQKLGSIESLTLQDWLETMNVNLTSPMLLSKYFYNKLAIGKGNIINIASIHHILTKRNFLSYATSKSALVGLTKAMSVDLNGKVRVNSISPAAIDTPMLLDGFNNDIQQVKKLNEIHPIQRIGQPDEVAKLALLLVSDDLGFINGANISMDGGISNVLKDI
jgi:NAD(P)-dependent dehydrogenase (short-subunit alcohol dehydrogenase family)